MALSNSGVFEADVGSGDDSLNAGYFNPAGSGAGTDYSTQSPLACTDLAIDATTNTKVSSSSIGFTSAHLRNGLRITAGTGFTAGLYEITSVSAGVATLDRACGTTSSTGGTARVGGAFASPGQAGALQVTGNALFIKAGTYTLSGTANTAGGPLRWDGTGGVFGYSTNRTPFNTDTPPELRPGANSVTVLSLNFSDSILFSNLSITNPSAKTGCTGIGQVAANRACIANVAISDVATAVNLGTSSVLVNVSATNPTTSGGGMQFGGQSFLYGCQILNGPGFLATGVSFAQRCAIKGNNGTGQGFNGFFLVDHCVAYSVTGTNNNGFNNCQVCLNCYAEGCTGTGGYGFGKSTATPQDVLLNCAGYNNAADYNATYYPSSRRANFQALSASGLANASGGDFLPNATAVAGALLRAASFPALFEGLGTADNLDIGLGQHADPAAGGGISRSRIFTGY